MQVFVASKFDNRLKEFAERWEVDKYLAATGYLPSNVRPFFVALPKVSCSRDCMLVSTGILAVVEHASWYELHMCAYPAMYHASHSPCSQDRNIQSSSDWRKQMAEVDAGIFKHLREGIKGGFDEERFSSRIGFNNLKK